MAALLAMCALPLTAAAPAAGTTVGSNLTAAPNGGVCPIGSSGETSCSFVQESLADGHIAAGGVQPEALGVITSWRVATGAATPATTSAKVRLRIIQAGGVSYAYGASPFEELPLGQPGVHVFAARLPIDEERQYIGIDTALTGNGAGEAAVPIAYRASRAGDAWKWVPGLSEGLLPQSTTEGDLELLLNATVEPDRDHDGYGDKTQDRCPEDRTRQRHCDRIPPRTKLTYAPRQDFLRTKKVVVYLRTNEAARAYATGQIDIKGVSSWGIYSDRAAVVKGKKRKLVLQVPGRAAEVAARSFAHGRRVTASVTVTARDAAGNESGATVALIKPKR